MTDSLSVGAEKIGIWATARKLDRWDELAKELNVEAENEAYPLLNLLEGLLQRIKKLEQEG